MGYMAYAGGNSWNWKEGEEERREKLWPQASLYTQWYERKKLSRSSEPEENRSRGSHWSKQGDWESWPDAASVFYMNQVFIDLELLGIVDLRNRNNKSTVPKQAGSTEKPDSLLNGIEPLARGIPCNNYGMQR